MDSPCELSEVRRLLRSLKIDALKWPVRRFLDVVGAQPCTKSLKRLDGICGAFGFIVYPEEGIFPLFGDCAEGAGWGEPP